MSETIKIEEDGFVTLEIGGTAVQADIYALNNRIYAVAQDFQDKPATEYHEALVAMLQEMGFPKVSHRAADQVVKQISLLIDRLKNADGVEPSPA